MISNEDKDMIEGAMPKLIGYMDLQSSNLLGQLRSRKAITTEQKDVIKCAKGKNNQADALLDILLMGDVDTLDKFIYSLRDSSHNHAELAKTYLRKPIKPDNWTEDTASGGQPASGQASGGPSETAGSKPTTREPIQMTEKHRRTIRDNFDVLTSDLDVDKILSLLVKQDIISTDDQDDILEERKKDRARAMLTKIMRREDYGFYVLRDGCAENHMKGLADLLKD